MKVRFDKDGRFLEKKWAHDAIEVDEKIAAYLDEHWVNENGDIKPINLMDFKNQLKEKIANARWKAVEGGFYLEGKAIRTRKDVRDYVKDAIKDLESGVLKEPLNWKSSEGFIKINTSQLKQIEELITIHIEKMFNIEFQVHEAIDKAENHIDLINIMESVSFPTPVESIKG